MTDGEILTRLADVARTTFAADERLVITAATTADDVAGWDSLKHALFLMNVERDFGLEFDPAEVIDLESVGELARLISRLLNGDDHR